MKLNPRNTSEKGTPPRLAGGYGPNAERGKAYEELRRIAVTWFLFEEPFYAKAQDTYQAVRELCTKVTPGELAGLAIECREVFNLRRMPLALARELARSYQGAFVGDTIAAVIRRPDELSDFLALYWLEGKSPLSKQVKRGLGLAAQKFDEYQWAKYDRDGAIKLRDVLFLSHAKPKTTDTTYTKKERKAGVQHNLTADEQVYKAIVERTLTTPDTWEVALSGGADKKDAFTRLILEKKLGDDAFLRNIRNMLEADVSLAVLRRELETRKFYRQLPTQFLAASKENPKLENEITEAFLRKAGQTKVPGNTVVVVDISGSMASPMSHKSDMTRMDGAIALAMILREACERCSIYATAGNDGARQHATALIPNRHGMALRDAIRGANDNLGGGGIFIVQVMDYIAQQEKAAVVDRVIVITDEQDCDVRSATANTAVRLGKKNYILNVAPERYGAVTGGLWTRISGFTERVVDLLAIDESQNIFQNEPVVQ